MAVRIKILEPDRPERNLVYTTGVDIIMGRASTCDVRIENDPMISRLHAGVHIDPPRIAIRDLGSRNGIVINGIRFDGVVNQRLIKRRALRDGDTVVLGRTSVQVEIADDTDLAPVPSRTSLHETQPLHDSSDATWIGGPTREDATDTAPYVPTAS
ncbi:MAG: FHA domain-containing protein [Planctomycetaceae bacterium]|nr:FHA domain-containing protein [Planctomycetaceae bacterium]